MQVRTPRRSSTIATQSKQAPIMHQGPRGAPDTAVHRVALIPAASKAEATLSPGHAGIGAPSNKKVVVPAAARRNIQST